MLGARTAAWNGSGDLYGKAYIQANGISTYDYITGPIVDIKQDLRIVLRIKRLDGTTTGGAAVGFQDPCYRLIPLMDTAWFMQFPDYYIFEIPSSIGNIENLEIGCGYVKNIDTGIVYGQARYYTYNSVQFLIMRQRPNARVYFVEIYYGNEIQHKFYAYKSGSAIGFFDEITGMFYSADGLGMTYGVDN